MPDHDAPSLPTSSPSSSSPPPLHGPWAAVRALGIIGLTFAGAKWGVVPKETVPLVLLGIAVPSDWITDTIAKAFRK